MAKRLRFAALVLGFWSNALTSLLLYGIYVWHHA